jgi:hypothetical protein
MNEQPKQSVITDIILYVGEIAKYHAELYEYLQDKQEFHKDFAIDLVSQLLGELCDLKEVCPNCDNELCGETDRPELD